MPHHPTATGDTHRAPSAIEAIIFDYAGVLGLAPFSNTASFEAAMGYPEGALTRLLFGDYVDPDGYSPGTVHDWHLLEIGQLDLATFIARAVERSPEHLGGATFDPKAYFEFMRGAPFGVHWMVVARARELHAAGYKTAILTNNVKEWGQAWRSTVPMDIFDAVVDSSEVGVRKPEPEIYHHTCEQLAVRPEQAVFLDDNARNCEGARAAGMDAILVGPDVWSALAELDALLDARGATSRSSSSR